MDKCSDGSTNGRYDPLYLTKQRGGEDPALGGYPTDVDTRYPFYFGSPFLGQVMKNIVLHADLSVEDAVLSRPSFLFFRFPRSAVRRGERPLQPLGSRFRSRQGQLCQVRQDCHGQVSAKFATCRVGVLANDFRLLNLNLPATTVPTARGTFRRTSVLQL